MRRQRFLIVTEQVSSKLTSGIHTHTASPNQASCQANQAGKQAHLQVEDGHVLVLRAAQLAAVDGVHDGARVAQLEAVAHACTQHGR